MAEDTKRGILSGKLRLNTITEDPNDYILRIVTRGNVSLEDLAKDVTAMRSGFMYQTVLDVLICFKEAVRSRMLDGFSINAGLFNAYLQAKGVYYKDDRSLDELKGQYVTWNISPGSEILDSLAALKVVIDGVDPVGPQIYRVQDVKSGQVNALITPNRNLKIFGDKLCIAGEKEDNGVFFVPVATGTTVKVDPTDIVDNSPKQLTIVIPELPAGDYTLRVVTQFSSSATVVKEPRSYDFEKILNVVK